MEQTENIEHVVLCVDDEENILRSLKRLLRKEGYKLLTASSGKEGLQVLSENPVNLVISDQRMPEMDGAEFLAQVKEKYPDTIRVCLTGYTDVDAITEAINKGHIYKFFLKPWNDQSLKLEIKQALEQYELIQVNRKLNKTVIEQNEALKTMNEGLEKVVLERTQDLEFQNQALALSHEILESIPIPIMGVSADGMIAVINRESKSLPLGTGGVEIGRGISHYFNEKVLEMFEKALQENMSFKVKDSLIGKDLFNIEIRPLNGRFKGKGCIFVVELSNGC